MPMRLCSDCLHRFPAYSSTSYRCKVCQQKANVACKLASQRKRLEARRLNEKQGDITAAEIDARFTAALKEIRRQKRPETEFGWNAAWKYSEPGR